VSPARHPAWCRTAFCDAPDPDLPVLSGSAHRGEPVRVSLPVLLDDDVEVVAQLRAPIGSWPGDTVLAVVIGEQPTLLLRVAALPAALAALGPLLAAADVEVRPDA
jgi:hypothetical protein